MDELYLVAFRAEPWDILVSCDNDLRDVLYLHLNVKLPFCQYSFLVMSCFIMHWPCGPPLLIKFGHERFCRHRWIRVFEDEFFPFHMYVSRMKILWSVVYINGYREKDKILNWVHNYNLDLTVPGTEFLQLAGRTSSKAKCIASLPAAVSYFLLSWACKRKCVHEPTLQCWSSPKWDKGYDGFNLSSRTSVCLMAAGNMSIFCNMWWVLFSYYLCFLYYFNRKFQATE